MFWCISQVKKRPLRKKLNRKTPHKRVYFKTLENSWSGHIIIHNRVSNLLNLGEDIYKDIRQL